MIYPFEWCSPLSLLSKERSPKIVLLWFVWSSRNRELSWPKPASTPPQTVVWLTEAYYDPATVLSMLRITVAGRLFEPPLDWCLLAATTFGLFDLVILLIFRLGASEVGWLRLLLWLPSAPTDATRSPTTFGLRFLEDDRCCEPSVTGASLRFKQMILPFFTDLVGLVAVAAASCFTWFLLLWLFWCVS